MTVLLTDNLPLLAGAPDGIQKLRELILELAVRGKLVPQESKDEPVSGLLKRLAKDKARLVEAGAIRKQKPLPPIAEADWPFELPKGWDWTRLADLAFAQAGFAFKSTGFNDSGRGLPLIRIRDVSQPFSGTFYAGEYRDEFIVENGEYLISMDGQFRVAPWKAGPALLNQRVTRLIFFGAETAQRFISTSLQARLLELQGLKAYTTVDHLSGGQIAESVIGLPPVAEQHRIVAKVDELMALCDRLEARQDDAESAHAKLVQELLDSLTQAADAADFAASWQRLAEHFDTLFTTESSIDAIKQALLQLAVTGKLVPQDPSDEPVSELLKRIGVERTAFIARGAVRNASGKTDFMVDGLDGVELPPSWEWTAFDNVIDPEYPIAYGVLVPGPDVPDGVPFVRIADLDLTAPPHQPEKKISREVDRQFRRTRIRGGEILMGVVGSIGKLGVAPESWAGANIARAICRLAPSNLISKDYVIWLLQSGLMREQFLGDTRTLAQPTLNVGLIRNASTPLPPLAEQLRIVAKLDQLMSLCDKLKARFSQARQLHEHLAIALVEQAVA